MPLASTCTLSHWQHFEHGSDVGVCGIGESMASAFEQAALAMVALVCEPHRVRAERTTTVTCVNADPELLLVDWLDAVIFEISVGRMLFSHFRVVIDGHRLVAELTGEHLDVGRHRPAVELKGATLTCLEVRQHRNGCWHAQCVVDV